MSTPARPPAPGDLAVLQDFLNTHDTDRRSDELADAGSARAALAELWPDADVVGEADLAHLIELREAIRDYLRTPRPPDAAVRLGGIAAGVPLRLEVSGEGGTRIDGRTAGAPAVAGRVLGLLHDAEASGIVERFKICGECGWAFYDGSRNRSSRWCDMATCGSRAKMRAYRARHREGGAA
jgi:predicted RNA-binding Zn ribbon-like protein